MNKLLTLTDAQAEAYRQLFDHICTTIKSYDPEFYWKEMICFEEVYVDADRANAIMDAITFMVGGRTDIRITPTKQDGLIATYTSAGYYKNIGA